MGVLLPEELRLSVPAAEPLQKVPLKGFPKGFRSPINLVLPLEELRLSVPVAEPLQKVPLEGLPSKTNHAGQQGGQVGNGKVQFPSPEEEAETQRK